MEGWLITAVSHTVNGLVDPVVAQAFAALRTVRILQKQGINKLDFGGEFYDCGECYQIQIKLECVWESHR